MTRRYLNLNARAWNNMCRAWRPPFSPSVLWQRYGVGPLYSSLSRMQVTALPSESEVLSGAAEDALIVLGYWRSGTTLLHELLAASGRWSYPTTHACMNPHSFLLRTPGQKHTKRPMDTMVIGSETPQEDEFAMLALGARSPYEALLFPKCLPDALRLADIESLSGAEQVYWKRNFSNFARMVSASQGNKPVLLKSPPHSCRIPTLRSVLPGCRFVVIVRNPNEIFESVVGMWREMFHLYAMTAIPSEVDIRLAILDNRSWFEKKLQKGLGTLSQGDYTVIRFEDLVADPAGAIAKLYEELNLGSSSDAEDKAEEYMTFRRGYRSESRLPPPEWQSRVTNEWDAIFRHYAYDAS